MLLKSAFKILVFHLVLNTDYLCGWKIHNFLSHQAGPILLYENLQYCFFIMHILFEAVLLFWKSVIFVYLIAFILKKLSWCVVYSYLVMWFFMLSSGIVLLKMFAIISLECLLYWLSFPFHCYQHQQLEYQLWHCLPLFLISNFILKMLMFIKIHLIRKCLYLYFEWYALLFAVLQTYSFVFVTLKINCLALVLCALLLLYATLEEGILLVNSFTIFL